MIKLRLLIINNRMIKIIKRATYMLDTIIRIATRKSPLALWQAHYVQQRLIATHPGLQVALVPMITYGDLMLERPLRHIGGKRLFINELELALLEDRADIAVHSMKDVPVSFPCGLGISNVCERDDPRDALVSHRFSSINQLPKGSVIGTSSLRRQCQIWERRPDLIVRNIRGNVGTRLAKLDNGDYDAVILAVAGLKRLGLEQHICCLLSTEEFLPAVGQGVIGIECRLDDETTLTLLRPLNHAETATRVRAERAVNTHLEGSCQVPIGSYAEINKDSLWLRALVGSPDGRQIIRGECRGPSTSAEQMGMELAEELLARGARKILQGIY